MARRSEVPPRSDSACDACMRADARSRSEALERFSPKDGDDELGALGVRLREEVLEGAFCKAGLDELLLLGS